MISEFIDKDILDSMGVFLESGDDEKLAACSVKVADIFGAGDSFRKISDESTDGEHKLISSFSNNLVLLIQKTWVEKSDVEMKAEVLYNLEQLGKSLESKSYRDAMPLFFSIVDDVVYLMFGSQTKSSDFGDYALRIDPEFGIFWWYVKSLPRNADWSEKKCRLALLLGMYFLANY